MKKIKVMAAAMLSLCLALGAAGCGGVQLKDNIINGFNDMLQYFSRHALTDEKDLQGDKTKGADAYTGTYSAEYEDFNGTEYVFGGTGLERGGGNTLDVTYELTVDSGSARLYWQNKDGEKVIADADERDDCVISLTAGDNYIAIEGDHFCGSLKLTVD